MAGKPFKNQKRGADPDFRAFVDDLIRAKNSGAPCTIDRTPTRRREDDAIVVRQRR